MKKEKRITIVSLIMVGLLPLLAINCKKEDLTIVPVLTTSAVSDITRTSATGGGAVTSDGGSVVTSRGICWSTGLLPTPADGKATDSGHTNSFTNRIDGLAPNTTYTVRAYAINRMGTGYGNSVSFTTEPVLIPELTTTAVSEIMVSTVNTGGTITFDGGSSVIAFGVCWSIGTIPTINDNKTDDASGMPGFTCRLKNLAENTTYNLRAFATNIAGTGYGNVITVTTPIAPVVTTSPVIDITKVTATSGGDAGLYSLAIIARGVCWSVNTAPTVDDNKTSDGAGFGSFASSITGLAEGTTYYLRAYATSTVGTGYGSTTSFTTQVSDLDGNVYNAVSIGTQVWMVENLKVTRLNNGTAILEVQDNGVWGALTSTGYSWYSNDAATYEPVYGAVYNGYTVNSGKLCPIGWKVPTNDAWTTLTGYLGGISVATSKMLEAGSAHWSQNEDATNESGFTALPGGLRASSGEFYGLGGVSVWWSSSADGPGFNWVRALYSGGREVEVGGNIWTTGNYVRCIKN